MPILTFHIKLVGTDPLVTRTFKVSSEMTIYELHHTIQVVMGWKNYHLYQFEVGDTDIADSRLWITGYFWGPESSSKDFLKPVKEEFGVGHAA
jgi:hypothetical protein